MAKHVAISNVHIPQLGIKDGLWRLDWLGDLRYNDRTRLKGHPSINVILSKVKYDDDSQMMDLNHKFATEFEHPSFTSVPISLLPVLKVGDLWRNGFRIRSPRYKTKTFDLRIDEESVREVHSNWRFQGYSVINNGFHPYHAYFPNSRCLLCNIVGSRDLVLIPVYELIRFYMGTTSKMVLALFNISKGPKSLYNPRKSYPQGDGDKAFIHLRANIKDRAAASVARIAFDPIASRAAHMIANSITRCAHGASPNIYPSCRFPFEGRTKLRVKGKKMPFDYSFGKKKRDRDVFVVYQILRCTGRFPFTGLELDRDNRGESDGTKDPTRPEAFSGPRPFVHHFDDHSPKFESVDPSSTDDEDVEIDSPQPEDCFTDLVGMQIVKMPRGKSRYRAANRDDETTHLYSDLVGIGDPGSQGQVIPGDLVETRVDQEEVPADLGFFMIVREKVVELCEGAVMNMVVLDRAEDEQFNRFPIAKTKTDRRGMWSFIDYRRGLQSAPLCRRGAAIARITIGVSYRYFFEIERRCDENKKPQESYSMLFGWRKSGVELSRQDLESILRICASNRGGWLKDELPHIYRQRVKHTLKRTGTASEKVSFFAARLSKLVKGSLAEEDNPELDNHL